MSKFLPINTKGELLNTDMIAQIIPEETGGCIILTKDGQHFHSEIDLQHEVNDYDSIRALIPCTGVDAVFLNEHGVPSVRACPFVMLMSDGKFQPLIFMRDEDIAIFADEGRTGFIGFVPAN